MENLRTPRQRKSFKTIGKVAQVSARLNQRRLSLPTIPSPLTQFFQLQQMNYFNGGVGQRKNDVLPKMSDSMKTVMQSLNEDGICNHGNNNNNNDGDWSDKEDCFEEEESCKIFKLQQSQQKRFGKRNSDYPVHGTSVSAFEHITQQQKQQQQQRFRQTHTSMSGIFKKNHWGDDNDHLRPATVASSARNSARSSISKTEDETLRYHYIRMQGRGSSGCLGVDGGIDSEELSRLTRRVSLSEVSTSLGFSASTRTLLERAGRLEDKIESYRLRNSDSQKDEQIDTQSTPETISEEDIQSACHTKSTMQQRMINRRRRKSVVF